MYQNQKIKITHADNPDGTVDIVVHTPKNTPIDEIIEAMKRFNADRGVADLK